MESEYEIIEIEKWKRSEHYKFYRNAENSFMGVSYNVDITQFFKIIKRKNFPFYYSMIYAITLCANKLDAFKYRINGENVILYKSISPSYKCLEKGTDLLKVVTVDFNANLSGFIADAKKVEEKQTEYFKLPARKDIFEMSCIPWISFMHISHTVSADKDDAVPKFTWGEHFREGKKILLPLTILIHHSFADGLDLGNFTKILQNYLDNFEVDAYSGCSNALDLSGSSPSLNLTKTKIHPK